MYYVSSFHSFAVPQVKPRTFHLFPVLGFLISKKKVDDNKNTLMAAGGLKNLM